MRKLDVKMRGLWYLGYSLLFALVVVAYICALVFAPAEEKELFYIIVNVIGIPLLLISCFLAVAYPALKYHYYSYSYDEKTIWIYKGVIFRKRIMIPVCQIQDLHLAQGPIMLMLKLSTLLISTAGSNYSIDGIIVSECENIISDMREKLEKRLEVKGNEEV